MSLSEAATAQLDALLADQVANSGLPALFYGVTSADGDIYFNCKGKRHEGDPSEGDIHDQTTLELWSMTKLITSIACLQLVDKGVLAVDDPALIETHLPELWAQPILTGLDADKKPITKPRTAPLTLRHLLTHTSGLAYPFTSPLLMEWDTATGHPSFLAKNATPASLAIPLLFEPGTKYVYGLGIDWAGILVTRVTGQTLEDYFHEHIFGPAGLTRDDISFLPSDSIRARLMRVCGVGPDGQLVPTGGMRDTRAWTPDDVGIHLGGAGLLGTAKAYMAVLRQILLAKDGRSQAISKSVYHALFAPAFPARGAGGNTCHADLGHMILMEGVDEAQYLSGAAVDHSLAMCLFTADSATGIKAGSGFWGGAARTRFWVDPETGIAGWYGTQLFDLGNPARFAKAYAEYQRTLYNVLDK